MSLTFVKKQLLDLRKGGGGALKAKWSLFYNKKIGRNIARLHREWIAPLFFRLGFRTDEIVLAKCEALLNKAVESYDLEEINQLEEKILKWLLNRKVADKYFIKKFKLLNTLFGERGDYQQFVWVQKQLFEYRKSKVNPNSEFEDFSSTIPRGAVGVWSHTLPYIQGKMLGMRDPRPPRVFFDPSRHPNNSSLMEHWTQIFEVKQVDPFEPESVNPLRSFPGDSVDLDGDHFQIYIGMGIAENHWLEKRKPPLLNLQSEIVEQGKQLLQSWGIGEQDWYVTAHVRESGYRNIAGNYEDHRNADIESYIPAFKAIVDAGGYVIRMGHSDHMRPIPPMEGVIDFVSFEPKKRWMDLFLYSRSSFCIGTSSGGYTFAKTFGVPILMTNLVPTVAAFSFTKKDLFIPKRMKKNGKAVDFIEMMSPPLSMHTKFRRYKAHGIEFEENSPDDIRSAVLQMIERKESGFTGEEIAPLSFENQYGNENIKLFAQLPRDFSLD